MWLVFKKISVYLPGEKRRPSSPPIASAHHMRWLPAILIFSIALLAAAEQCLAQEAEKKPFVQFSGSAEVSNDVYDFWTNYANSEPARRPPNLTRLVFTPTITIGDLISLPFNIQISSRETNFTTPLTENPTLAQFLENPLNNIGFISVSPKIGWAKLYLGTHTPIYSELTAGDQPIFGAGFDLTPGKFELASSAGIAQRAVDPDSTHGIKGAYRRSVYMTKIGFGNPDSSCVALNILKMSDDPNSIRVTKVDSSTPQAQEGIVSSLNFGVQIAEPLRLSGEVAVSGFTMDLAAIKADALNIIPDALLSTRVSTRADAAGMLAIDFNQKTWGVRTSGKYIGPGYFTAGYPYLTPDRLEFLVAPRVALFNGGLSLSTSVGYRVNNLTETKGATMTQFIGSANAMATLSDAFSISAQYANFGVRNNEKNDTIKIESVSNSFSVSPTYTLQASGSTHMFNATFSLDAFSDLNTITGAQASNNTRNIQGVYSLSLLSIPLTSMLMLGNLVNHLPAYDLTINSSAVEFSYDLLDGKLSPMIGGGYAESSVKDTATHSPDIQRILRAGIRYQISKLLTFRMVGSMTGFSYGGSRSGEFFRESLLSSSISAQF